MIEKPEWVPDEPDRVDLSDGKLHVVLFNAEDFKISGDYVVFNVVEGAAQKDLVVGSPSLRLQLWNLYKKAAPNGGSIAVNIQLTEKDGSTFYEADLD